MGLQCPLDEVLLCVRWQKKYHWFPACNLPFSSHGLYRCGSSVGMMSGWHGRRETLRRRKWTTSSSSEGKKWKPGGHVRHWKPVLCCCCCRGESMERHCRCQHTSVEARTLADAVEEENDGDPHSCWHMLRTQ
uniref:Uncharacterized protein n=1 Tax=Oryza nivara TaxID=4536 RepID=A0A0E0G859_ORYNI